MEFKSLLKFLTCLALISLTEGKSTDYGRHLELSLLFYECQRSGPLPKTNRIYWRHDSMVDAGKDVGHDLPEDIMMPEITLNSIFHKHQP